MDMTELGRPTVAHHRRAAGAEPAESESKQQTSVEKTAANPEYTWSQTAEDEVTFEMPVRALTNEHCGFVCAMCRTKVVEK